jgi:thiamine-phosphate pyrophosphorylase
VNPLPQPPLLLITDAAQSRVPLLDTVAAALRGGCRWVGLREKARVAADRAALLKELLRLAAGCGATIMVHGDLDAAAMAGARGVHLNRAEQIASARESLSRGALIGFSAHDGADIAAAAGADYVTLSPMFPTASKPGYGPALGLARFAELAAGSALPVLALGGITAHSIGACIEAGAAGVAVMGEIMRAEDPASTTAAMIHELARSFATVE